MFDLRIRGGTLIDGTGAAPRTADVGVSDGKIAAIGRLDEPARRDIDATGLLVTPGFVDIHAHYDGQATWDSQLTPSAWHGVTTVVMGNCGVGFSAARPFESRTNSHNLRPRDAGRRVGRLLCQFRARRRLQTALSGSGRSGPRQQKRPRPKWPRALSKHGARDRVRGPALLAKRLRLRRREPATLSLGNRPDRKQ